MKTALALLLAGAALALSIPALAAENEKPQPALPAATDPMTKIVFRSVARKLPPGHPDGQPKTLYRVGERWGRLEHPFDRLLKAHPVVIVASPDVWFVVTEGKTAQHSLDPGPRFAFRAPIVDQLPKGAPPELLDFEFGRELEFVEAHGGKKERVKSDEGVEADRYQAEVGDVTVYVNTLPDSQEVRSALVLQDKRILAGVQYDEYRRDLEADPKLFQLPKGTKIIEAGAAAPPAKEPGKAQKKP